MSWSESGDSASGPTSAQGHLSVPPWRDTDLYTRNSPLFHVEQCQTPLLIIQGDMDFVPMQQGEEFFRAMQRLGKRARFARYWGEGHVIQGGANTRDMMQQTFQWFDEFLMKPENTKGSRQKADSESALPFFLPHSHGLSLNASYTPRSE